MNATRKEAPWLLADVGGTNVRFALGAPGTVEPLRMDSIYAYRVADFATFADAARSFLEVIAARPRHAVFAVAGPVRGDEAQLTNHPWLLSAAQLRTDLALESVRLVNDFAAVGMSLPLLRPEDVTGLSQSVGRRGPRHQRQTFCVLGPGTGLGVSALALVEGTVVGLETEGGHISFAPNTDEEAAVLRHLLGRFGRVSLERVLCGAGLVNLYEALCAIGSIKAATLAPEEITTRALGQSDALCLRAVTLFCDILASTAGDFVLAYGAWDGAYLAGGVLNSLMPWLQQERFARRFCDKGRFAPAMQNVPLGRIVHPQPGLLGAAALAVVGSGRPLLGESATS